MMKKITLLLLLVILGFQGFSQCPINPYIQNNYEFDAKIFLLRDILNNPSDLDFDNPFINEDRLIPYLEKLSAIYENPSSHPAIDSLFNEFQIHANVFYSPTVAYYNRMEFVVEHAMPWVEDFRNTGISGVMALDNLMTDYEFFIDSFIVLNSAGFTGFYIETTLDFLNVTALVDDFAAIPGLHYVQPNIRAEDGFNYTGIPYELLLHEFVEACNIEIDGDIFTFSLLAGDCPMGCSLKKSWRIQVTEDCVVTVLSTPENDVSKFVLYPNPASDKIYLKGISSEVESVQIYSVQGKLLQSLKNISTEIDVSQLKSGIYFMQLLSSEGNTSALKFIKE